MDGKAKVRQIYQIGAPPDGGTPDRFVVPFAAGKLIYLQTGLFTADANAADRFARVVVRNPSGLPVGIYGSDFVLTATEAQAWIFDSTGAAVDNDSFAFCPIRAGGVHVERFDTVAVDMLNIQVGDVWGNPILVVFMVDEEGR